MKPSAALALTNDLMTFAAAAATPGVINGTANADNLNGTDINETIDGGAGDDQINGMGGNDSLIGGIGNDYLRGEQGNNTMSGGEGDDWFWFADGIDSANGDAGNDSFLLSQGSGTINGGNNNDSLFLSDVGVSNQTVIINLKTGVVSSGDGTVNYQISNLENAYGSNFDDQITLTDMAGVADGGNGDDNWSAASAMIRCSAVMAQTNSPVALAMICSMAVTHLR